MHSYNALSITNDELLNKALSSSNVEQRIEAYKQLSVNMINVNDAKSLEYFNMAMYYCEKNRFYDIAYELIESYISTLDERGCIENVPKVIETQKSILQLPDFQKEKSKVFMVAASTLIKGGVNDYSIPYLLKAYNYSSEIKDTNEMIRANINIGCSYGQFSDFRKALEYFLDAEMLSKRINNKKWLSDVYINMGVLYAVFEDYDKALDYNFKALKFKLQEEDKNGLWTLYNNVADIYEKKDKLDEAIVYLKKAFDSKSVETKSDEAFLYLGLGEIFLRKQQYDSAFVNLNMSYNTYKADGNVNGVANALTQLGYLYSLNGSYDKALSFYKKALQSYQNLKSQTSCKIVYEKLSDLYNKQGDFKEAYKYQTLALHTADSILSKERQQSVKTLENHLKIKESSVLYEQEFDNYKQSQQIAISRHRMQSYLLLVILIIVALIALIILYFLTKVKKVNSLLRSANNEINATNDELEDTKERLQKQYLFLNHLLNAIPTPIVYFSKRVIIGCNEAFERASGESKSALIGSNINDVYNKTGIGWSLDSSRARHILQTGQSLEQIVYADKKVHDVICYLRTLYDEKYDEEIHTVVLVDVTDLENTRRKLSESQKQLRDALNVKSKFFSIFAHDLKNPFNGILGMTNLITEYYYSYSPQDILKYISVINDSATHVYNLLTNMLDWAKSQTGMLEKNMTKFIITEPVNEAIKLNNHIINSKNITVLLKIEREFDIWADKNMILTVFRNLIGNAIKYTPNEGTITVDVHSVSESDIRISITDNGIGISPDNINKLFNVDNPISTPGLSNEKGVGLGLIICQEFVKQNGGTIIVESELGKGTTFSFCLKKA